MEPQEANKIRRFIGAADEAGIDKDRRRVIFDAYTDAAPMDTIIEGDMLSINKAAAESFLHTLFEEYRTEKRKTVAAREQKRLYDLGHRLYGFGDTQFQPDIESLSDADRETVSLMTKYLEEFMYDGGFIPLAENRATTGSASALSFLINRLAKIHTNEHYRGMLADFDPERLASFVEEVKKFALETGMDASKDFQTSADHMSRVVGQAISGKKGAVGLYFLKNSIVAASVLNGEKRIDPLIAAASYKYGQAGYNMLTRRFSKDAGFFRSGGRRNKLHYDPRQIVFAGVSVQYLKEQRLAKRK